jgi:DNA mismatch endonuclease (patch repair protein)
VSAQGAKGQDKQRAAMDRSAVMRAVKSEDTAPERALRKMLRAVAPGYRLHRADLPGKPDVVYGPHRLAIFMHGCFWHGHDCKRGARPPKNNAEYWRGKISRNRARDEKNVAALAALGWRALTVFECELKDERALRARLDRALAKPPAKRRLPRAEGR